MSKNAKIGFLLTVVAMTATAAALLPHAGQDPGFHRFVDDMGWLGVPNFGNVASNVFFLLVGIWGFVEGKRTPAPGGVRVIFGVLCAGIVLTGIGSMYYHWAPDNDRMIWDRMPMTIVFMSVLALTVAVWVDRRAGVWLLVPLLALGLGSVLWWHHTEMLGVGDLRLYWWVQFFPMMGIPTILLLFRRSGGYAGVRSLVWVVIWYAAAKLLEVLDGKVLSWTGVVSGHTLKHIAAAVSTGYLVAMCKERYRAGH